MSYIMACVRRRVSSRADFQYVPVAEAHLEPGEQVYVGRFAPLPNNPEPVTLCGPLSRLSEHTLGADCVQDGKLVGPGEFMQCVVREIHCHGNNHGFRPVEEAGNLRDGEPVFTGRFQRDTAGKGHYGVPVMVPVGGLTESVL